MTAAPGPGQPDEQPDGAPPAAGYLSGEGLSQPFRPAFAAPGGGLGPAPAMDRSARGRGGVAAGVDPARSRGLSVLVLAIGIGIGVLLVAGVVLLQPATPSLSLLLTVLFAILCGPVLAGILTLRLARALTDGSTAVPAAGEGREAAADAAAAAPLALAVTDRSGELLFANRRMRQLALAEELRPGASLPHAFRLAMPGQGAATVQEQPVRLPDGRQAQFHCLPLPHPDGRLLWHLVPRESAAEAAAILLRLAATPGLGLQVLPGDPRGPGPAVAATGVPDPALDAEDPAEPCLPALWWDEAGTAGSARGRAIGLVLQPGAGRLWLRTAEEMPALLAAIEDLPVGAALLDAAGRVQLANAGFSTLTGWQPGSAGLSELVAEGERGTLKEALSGGATVAGSDPATLRFACAPDRSVHFYLGRAGTEAGGRLALLVDVTRQKGVEQQFAHGQKMQAIGQLAGGVAHDFNNLLTAMIGFCDLLLQRHPPTDQSFADVQQIKQNALRAAGLVRQLLAFSRRQTLRPRPLDVVDVLADLRHLISRLIGEQIQLKIVHGRNLGIVRVDRGQLEQVIINLAVNARDAMRDGGSLAITTSAQEVTAPLDRGSDRVPPGRYVRIDVADTGTGVPQEHADKIFDPFFTTKKQGEGTGLGLSTVYGIIRQTGGFVFLDRNGPDGATFSILLPETRPEDRAEGEEAAEAGTERPPVPRDLTGRETLLLVEDEDAVRLFAARSLRNKGYTVMEAASGEAALELSRAFAGPIHGLVTDVVMPNMDGPTLAQKVVADRPGMAVVFMSGYAEDAVRQTLSGGDLPSSFLQKPFTLNDLAVTVKAALGGAESGHWPSKG